MSPPHRRGGRRKLAELYRLSRPAILPGILLFGILGFAYLFELLPKATNGPPTIASTGKAIAESSWAGAWRLGSRVAAALPAWVPFWSISKPTGLIDLRLPNAEELEKDASIVLPLIENLKRHVFFRIYKVDLDRECPFWARADMCSNPGACSVCECGEDQIPKEWKMKPLENFVDRAHCSEEDAAAWSASMPEAQRYLTGRDILPETSHVESFTEGNDAAFALKQIFETVSSEHSSTASYVDLSLNKPGNTAYKGRNIWGLIYKENCMGVPDDPFEDFKAASGQCTEEQAFYKIVSGMQTCIMVLAAEYNQVVVTSGEAPPQERDAVVEDHASKCQALATNPRARPQYKYNLELFRQKLANQRAWLENLYFDFGILMKTLCHVAPILEDCPCSTGQPEDDSQGRAKLRQLLKTPFSACKDVYMDVPLFERKKELAMRQFWNISRIMDCLECEKCRLHGIVKINALQVALRASGRHARVTALERNEVIALVNAIGYFADAIAAIGRFERRLFHRKVLLAFSLCLIGTCAGYWRNAVFRRRFWLGRHSVKRVSRKKRK